MLRNKRGFTLIELVVFIVVLGIISGAILLALKTVMKYSGTVHNDVTAAETAAQCLESYFGKRSTDGYAAIPNGTFTGGNLPLICSVPTGYTATVTVSTPDGFDSDYKQISVAISGLATLSMSLLIANY